MREMREREGTSNTWREVVRMLASQMALDRLAVSAFLAFLALFTPACQPAPSDPPQKAPRTLYYFTWSDYVDRETLTEFEQWARAKVVVDTFSSNEELLAKLQSGADGYD